MPLEFFEKRDIVFACFHFTMDGTVYPDDLGKTLPFSEFYSRIRGGALPTTSQPNAEDYVALWEPFLKEGKDVLHGTLSSGISGAWNSALAARSELAPKYPDRKLYVVDTLCASSGFGLIMDSAADLRDQGKTIDEVRDWMESNKNRVHHWFSSHDLTHFRRGGRISAASAIFGTMLNICPVMNVDFEGKLVPREKVRTKKKALQALVEKMAQNAVDGENYSGKCFISNSACYDEARYVADLIEQRFPKLNGKVLINTIGGVIGSHTGCGTVALFFWGSPRVD